MFRKTMTALAAIVALGMVTVASSSADARGGFRGGGWGGRGIGLGVVGLGVAGAYGYCGGYGYQGYYANPHYANPWRSGIKPDDWRQSFNGN
jgi:hypothetical protein